MKFRSEPHIQIFKMAAPSSSWALHNITDEISHLLIFGARTWHFCKIMMSLQGNSLQKLGNPPKNRDFGWFHLVKCIPITKLNVTIPVLFKTSIKASPHPLSLPPSRPLSPHLACPTLLAPTPLALSTMHSHNNSAPPAKSKSAIKNS